MSPAVRRPAWPWIVAAALAAALAIAGPFLWKRAAEEPAPPTPPSADAPTTPAEPRLLPADQAAVNVGEPVPYAIDDVRWTVALLPGDGGTAPSVTASSDTKTTKIRLTDLDLGDGFGVQVRVAPAATPESGLILVLEEGGDSTAWHPYLIRDGRLRSVATAEQPYLGSGFQTYGPVRSTRTWVGADGRLYTATTRDLDGHRFEVHSWSVVTAANGVDALEPVLVGNRCLDFADDREVACAVEPTPGTTTDGLTLFPRIDRQFGPGEPVRFDEYLHAVIRAPRDVAEDAPVYGAELVVRSAEHGGAARAQIDSGTQLAVAGRTVDLGAGQRGFLVSSAGGDTASYAVYTLLGSRLVRLETSADIPLVTVSGGMEGNVSTWLGPTGDLVSVALDGVEGSTRGTVYHWVLAEGAVDPTLTAVKIGPRCFDWSVPKVVDCE